MQLLYCLNFQAKNQRLLGDEEKYDAPMTGFHLELKRPFLTVTAEEIVPQVIERSKRFLRYFVIDCRPSNEIAGGKFGQAWVLSLEQIRNPKKKKKL